MSEYQAVRDAYLGTLRSCENRLPNRMRLALSFLQTVPVEKFLDVGCGDGSFASVVMSTLKGVQVYGTDVSEKAVKLSTEKGISAVRADLSWQRLPFDSGEFDAVFAGEVIEHVFDTDHFLDEMHRVLKSRGYLILTTPNLSSLYNRISLLIGYEPFSNNPSLRFGLGHMREFEGGPGIVPGGDHIRVMTVRSLTQLLKYHSFLLVRVCGDEAVFQASSRTLRWVRSFDTLVRKVPQLSHRVVVFCKKP